MAISNHERVKLKNLGRNIKSARLAAKLTQEALAEKADLNLRNLQRIEAGELNILITTLIRIQHALECRWDSLMTDRKGTSDAK